MDKRLIFILFVFVFIPMVNAENLINESYDSRFPITNNTIEQDYIFDGANYRMITGYGDYNFLSPHYIMEYYNLDGVEIIDKSVWVLQHDTWGTWEALEDFTDIELFVNETQHILKYRIHVKEKGTNYYIANVTIGFYSSGYSGNKPKIIIDMIKNPDWDNLGYGSFRWIWNVVPKGNYFKYVNVTSKEYVDINTVDVNGNDSMIYFTENNTYSDFDQWIAIDVSDYGIVPFKGGDEDYWNGKGFSLIFPVNETQIDPSFINTATSVNALRPESARKVFENPRGLQYHYVCYSLNSTGYYLFNSSDGTTWNIDYGARVFPGLSTANMDLAIAEDDSNNRLLVYFILEAPVYDVKVYCYSIADGDGTVTKLWEQEVFNATDDNVWYPSVVVDDDDYLWVSMADEYTAQGKQRMDVWAKHTQTTLPASIPSWSNDVKVYDGSSLVRDPGYGNEIRTQLTPLYATGDVACVYWIYEFSANDEINGRTITRASPLSGTPTLGNEVVISTTSTKAFSTVTETEANSDVFVCQRVGTTAYVYEWDVSGDSVSTFDTIPATYSSLWSITISIDGYGDPDNLYVAMLEEDPEPVPIGFHLLLHSSNVSTGDFQERQDQFLTSYDTFDRLSSAYECNFTFKTMYQNRSLPYKVWYYTYTTNVVELEVQVIHISLEANETQIDDYEKFELNITIQITNGGTENFSRNILTLDPTGLSLNITYLNGTGASELYDPNNYIVLDTSNSVKGDLNSNHIYVKYVLHIHENITKEGWFDVKSWSNETYQGANDTDTYYNVFNLTLRTPQAPTRLFGGGFQNAISNQSYVELHWTFTGSLYDGFEVYNSTNKVSWDLLGTSSTTNFTDNEVYNLTQRYYRVRAYRTTGVNQKNSSYTDINYEEVYFEPTGVAVERFHFLIPISVTTILLTLVYIIYVKRW